MLDYSHQSLAILAAMFATGLYFTHLRTRKEPGESFIEPTKAPQRIPYIGHILGLMRYQNNYYAHVSERTPLPIYTLDMLFTKMYVIKSAELIAAAQKHPKTLSFAPIEAAFASRVCAVGKETNRILHFNIDGDNGEESLSMDSFEGIRGGTFPGPALDAMNRVAIQNVAASLERLRGDGNGPVKIGLLRWLRHEITLATTNAVYGPMNPFKDPEVEDSFWDFAADLAILMLNIAPAYLAPSGHRGRNKAAQAFENYFLGKDHESGSLLVQNRYNASHKHGISVADIARFEVGGSIAVLLNTSPATFWTLYHILKSPDVLEELRSELSAVMTAEDDDRHRQWSLDVTNLKSACPLLASTFQEVLRHRACSISIRQVMEDTVLNEQYLLRKGCVVQMPASVVHGDSAIWGSDVKDFDHKRFLPSSTRATEDKGRRRHPAAFRAFGGGHTLCPGRHFATMEILALVAMFVMRFDLAPVAGTWPEITHDKTNIAAAIMEPDDDIEVLVSMREGFENCSWAFTLGSSEKIFALVSEDT